MTVEVVNCVCGRAVPGSEWVEHLNLNDGRKHRIAGGTAFRPNIEGRPGRMEIQHRTEEAARQLALRGMGPEPQPLLTAFWELAVRTMLIDKGITDLEELTYYLAWAQMTELETLSRSLTQNTGPKLLHLATATPPRSS